MERGLHGDLFKRVPRSDVIEWVRQPPPPHHHATNTKANHDRNHITATTLRQTMPTLPPHNCLHHHHHSNSHAAITTAWPTLPSPLHKHRSKLYQHISTTVTQLYPLNESSTHTHLQPHQHPHPQVAAGHLVSKSFRTRFVRQ